MWVWDQGDLFSTLSSVFYNYGHPTIIKRFIIVVLIGISLMVHDVEHLFMRL